MKKVDEVAVALEEERDALRRELAGTQEMLALVLNSVGSPVLVPHEVIKRGLPDNTQIQIDDDAQLDGFIFQLTEVE
jgi:hypothetical protein